MVAPESTYAYKALQHGVPTVIYGQDVHPCDVIHDPAIGRWRLRGRVATWDAYRDFIRYPFHLGDAPLPELLRAAGASQEPVAEFMRLFMGEPMDSAAFAGIVEEPGGSDRRRGVRRARGLRGRLRRRGGGYPACCRPSRPRSRPPTTRRWCCSPPPSTTLPWPAWRPPSRPPASATTPCPTSCSHPCPWSLRASARWPAWRPRRCSPARAAGVAGRPPAARRHRRRGAAGAAARRHRPRGVGARRHPARCAELLRRMPLFAGLYIWAERHAQLPRIAASGGFGTDVASGH